MSERISGVIKSIKRVEGYGFVTHDATGDDYFFHKSQVKESSFDSLEQDQAVTFVPSDGPKGPRATDVRVVR